MNRALGLGLLLFLLSLPLAGQGVVTTIAGTDWFYSNVQAPALSVPMTRIGGLFSDPQGNIYISEQGNRAVWRLNRSGVMTRILGNGIPAEAGDNGPALDAATGRPSGVVVDPSGNIYVTDAPDNSIRKVSTDGIVRLIAGTTNPGYSGDGGLAVNAMLNEPTGITLDSSGNLYFVDAGNQRIRRISPAGVISTIAGTGVKGYSGDGGAASSAQLSFGGNHYNGILVDAAGNLLFCDTANSRVRKITPSGVITTFAGNGSFASNGDGGPATAAAIAYPTALAMDYQGSLYIADANFNYVRKVTPDGVIRTFAGNGNLGDEGNGGSALAAAIGTVTALTAGPDGTIYLSNFDDGIVRAVSPAGTISAVAGNGQFSFGGDGGSAVAANLFQPTGAALDGKGNLYIADQLSHRVRIVTPDGTIHTFAGTGDTAYNGDGIPATRAGLYYPQEVAVDSAGNVLIADWGHCRIRRVDTSGMISTVAGNGSCTHSGDGGLATAAGMGQPSAVAIDSSGDLFITFDTTNRVRKVSASGIISTLAGTGTAGFSGDGGPALAAQLNFPSGITVDGANNVYIADSGNSRVRQISATGIISTIAGNGNAASSGDGGPATAAAISGPFGIVLDSAGNIYVSDSDRNNVRLISKGTISTIAGYPTTTGGYCCDGALATQAIFGGPAGLALDSTGSLFIVDSGNFRVRQILSHPVSMSVSTSALTFAGLAGGALPQPQTFRIDGSVFGMRFDVAIDFGSGPSGWLTVDPVNGVTPRLVSVQADPTSLAAGTYNATVTVTPENNLSPPLPIRVSFVVAPGAPPKLSVNTNFLTFTFPKGAAKLARTATVSNTGSGTLNFSAGAATVTGGTWLSVSPATGSVTPASPAQLAVLADPGGLSAGTYTGQVAVTAGGALQLIDVVMTISSRSQAILLSQTGLSFLAVAGGSTNLPPQSFGVLNLGAGPMSFNVSASTLKGGNWLHAAASSATSDPSQPAPLVQVTVDPTGLAEGVYYGTVEVDAPGAANSPQVTTIFLQVLNAGAQPGSVVQPREMVFTSAAGGPDPPGQFLSIYNLLGAPVLARSDVITLTSGSNVLFFRIPRNFAVSPAEPYRMIVEPLAEGSPPGTYHGQITIGVTDGSLVTVPLTLVVTGAPVTPATRSTPSVSTRRRDPNAPAADTSCSPTTLLPSLVTIGQSSTVQPGLPAGIWINVTDNCGNYVDSGSVVANFSNADPPLLLQPLGSGRWQKTWSTGFGSNSQVSVTVKATQGSLQGTLTIPVGVTGPQQPPRVDASAIVSAANRIAFVPAAPGAILSITGSNLASSPVQAPTGPLPPSLGDTTVIVAGQTVPLFYADPQQIYALLPFGIETNTTHQVLIRRGITQSQPVPLNVAAAQPALFTIDGSQALATVTRGSQTFENGAGAPASSGDGLLLYATGLGAVSPPIPAGSVAPSSPLASIDPAMIKLQIGSTVVPVSSAALTPEYIGLYQIQCTLPAGISTGPAVPITVTIGGQTSPNAFLTVQ